MSLYAKVRIVTRPIIRQTQAHKHSFSTETQKLSHNPHHKDNILNHAAAVVVTKGRELIQHFLQTLLQEEIHDIGKNKEQYMGGTGNRQNR